MRSRAWIFLLTMVANLLTALSTGGQLYWLIFLVMACVAGLALVSVALAALTFSMTYSLSSPQVTRGGLITLQVQLQHSAPLPIAPVTLRFYAPDGGAPIDTRALVAPFKRALCKQQFACPHVGLFPTGIERYQLSDVFGLFMFRRKPGLAPVVAVVQPATFPVRPLQFAPGESGNDAMARATEDITSPADVRAYQDGDELKRVHWKISMRKRELMVKRYEEPEHPDALILMNCAPPADDTELAYAVRDALCETAASLAVEQVQAGHLVRMPLIGAHAREVSCEHLEDLPVMLDALAQVPFDGTDRFERVLELETRRMRRTGGTVVITSRLDSNITDMVMRIRRMGPRTRLYYIHEQALPEEIDNLLLRMQRHDIEVETIALVPDGEEVPH